MTFTLSQAQVDSKADLYDHVATQLHAMLAGERNFIANAANFASLLFYSLPDLNWAGFYLGHDSELVLGPFQGKPACIRIPVGQGVCGAAAACRQTVLVPNVHEFPGHIACDAASKSEIVIPLIRDEQLIGVLDLDSPLVARFDDEDAAGLNRLVEIFIAATDAPD